MEIVYILRHLLKTKASRSPDPLAPPLMKICTLKQECRTHKTTRSLDILRWLRGGSSFHYSNLIQILLVFAGVTSRTTLLTPQDIGRWYTVYMDNFYNIVSMSEHLLDRQVHSVGSLHNHRDEPREIRQLGNDKDRRNGLFMHLPRSNSGFYLCGKK